MASTGPRRQDVVLSGGFGTSTNSARSGFLPICLARAPLSCFDGISIYLRTARGEESKESFTLYSSDASKFTQDKVDRLSERGVKFVYIPMVDQSRFREQTESKLLDVVDDPSIAISVKSDIVYETSIELVNELLSEPDLIGKSPRLEKVSRAVTTLVLNDPTSFSHLFTTSHHDFYTATHMVNVATWMVPLAYALGHHDTDELNHICQAGLLHDIGKMYIPAEILNKKGRLSDEEWRQIQQHPQMGIDHLAKFEKIHPLVHTITLQHHERMDGSGYPRGLRGDQLDPISKIAAVVDSFDAMTAFRPFKTRTMSVAEALDLIVHETPQKYDPQVVEAWISLLQVAEKQAGPASGIDTKGRRKYPRFTINCPARAHVVDTAGTATSERPGIPVTVHNISRAGLGFLSQAPIRPGDQLHVYLQGAGSLTRVEEGMTVRCRVYRDGWYDIGLQFAKIADEAMCTFPEGSEAVIPAA